MIRTTRTIAAAALAVTASTAFAGSPGDPAQEPAVAPSPAPAATSGPDWTGFYAGGQLGYADIDSNAALSGDDVIGGLVAGYDYDLGDWVIGAGVDYDFANISLGGVDLENIWRLKARAGYKIGDGLLYGTAGYANADTDIAGNDDGYFVGAGYEYLITRNVSLGGEVLYHEFNNFNGTATDFEATTAQVRATFRF